MTDLVLLRQAKLFLIYHGMDHNTVTILPC